MAYHVYIVRCSDNTLYCGYTTNLKRRVREHNNSYKGAKYTHPRRPVKLVYSKKFDTLSDALKTEHKIKQFSREEKEKLVNEGVRVNDM